MNRLKHILRHRFLFKLLAIIIIVLVLTFDGHQKRKSIYSDEEQFTGIVYKIKKNTDKTIIYLKCKENLIIKYYDNLPNISLGDKIIVYGTLEKPSNNTIPNIFNYQKYLYNNNIYYLVKSSKIVKVANNTSLLYYFKNIISQRISKISKNNEYILLFILGDNTLLSKDIINSYRMNGISHLFSISGMHISLFASIILYLLKRISYNNYYNYGIVIFFLFFYAMLVDFSPSVIRSLTMYSLFTINKLLNLKIKSIDIMCLVLIILLVLNPNYLFNIAFEYSYLISFSLILLKDKIKRISSYIKKSLYISFVAFLVTFPITIANCYEVNILSIFLNIIFVPLVSFIVFPLAIITFIFPFFSKILYFLVIIIENVSVFISERRIGMITFSKPSIFLMVLYYIAIYLFLLNKKYIIILCLIAYSKFSIYFTPSIIITAFDVGQGDSIFIKFPYNKGNILIDTGGNVQSNFELVKNKTIPYLKSIGISKINYLITTHGDFDHMGEAINLVNNFKVEKVIFNCGEYNDLEKELIKVLDKKKIKYYSCIKELNIDKNKLYFLQTKEYDNENDNSNVIYTELGEYKFMFMGDASQETEKEIMDEYNLSDIDVLKIGHHGSKTSSSIDFINEINPNYSIISVGKNNRYGHPNKEVLDNLKDSNIYRTDQDGSIMFKIKNKKLKIETCVP